MEFVPRIKPITQTNKDQFAVPERCKEILEKIKNEKKPLILLEDTDPSKIIYLLTTFVHRTAGGIEKQLNKYFMRELSAKSAFLTTFINSEIQIRAVGMKKLKYTYRVLLGHDVVDSLYQRSIGNKDQPLGPLHPEIHRCYEELLHGLKGDVISLPIFPPTHSKIKFFLLSILEPKDDLMHVIRFACETFRYCLPTLINTILHDIEVLNALILKSILEMITELYNCFNNIKEVIFTFLNEVITLTHSMEGSLYLVDPDNDMEARLFTTVHDRIECVNLKTFDGIAGRTARTGSSIIIKRSQPDLLEQTPHLHVKCVFSFPIYYKRQLVCVVVVYNKRSGDYMLTDCEIAQLMENYAGELLAKCIFYHTMKHFIDHSQLSYRMLTNYRKFDDAAIQQMLSCQHGHLNIDSFDFDPRTMALADMTTFALKIFENLNLIERFKIDRTRFAKFILQVKFAFQDVPYHNWTLSFTTLHFAYLVISTNSLIEKKILSAFEVFITLLTCLTHNLDYRGPVNAFKLQLGASFENFYTSAGQIMEIQNFCQLVNILGLNECNFLEDFENIIYINLLEMINRNFTICDIIKNPLIRTDAAKPYPSVFSVKFLSPRLKFTLMGAIIHIASHSDFIRDFKTSLDAFRLLHQELQQTKDYSIIPNNYLPNVQYDTLSSLHKNFLRSIVQPSLVILADLLPDLGQYLDNLHEITTRWKYSSQIFHKCLAEDICPLEVLNREDFADNVLELQFSCDAQSDFDTDLTAYVEETEEEDMDNLDTSDTSEDEDKILIAALDKGSVESMFQDVF